MPYDRILIDDMDYVVLRDGQEIERRPATEQELAVTPPLPLDATEVVRATLTDQATTALVNNRSFLAIASPTNAQNAAQIKALTRQMNALIRMTLNQLDASD